MNKIYQPYLNPVKFVEIEPADIPQYVSSHMDDWLFTNTIRPFEEPVNFRWFWLMDDSIRLQYITNFSPLTLKLFTCDGEEIYSQEFETKQQDFFRPGFYIRQAELDFGSLTGLEEGKYYLTIPEAGWISDPFDILEEGEEESVYVEYSHHEFYGDIIFDIPFTPAIRLPSINKYKKPGGRLTVYEDQNESETLIKYTPFRVYNFILGGLRGVPPWMIDKVDRIFGCSNLKIDGRYYTRIDSAEWEETELENYPMSGWLLPLREANNRSSQIYENEVQITGKVAMMSVADSKGFGIDDSGGDYLEIPDVE